MKKETKEKKQTLPERIMVRLDGKTTVIIRKLKSLKVWKKRYPMATIIH